MTATTPSRYTFLVTTLGRAGGDGLAYVTVNDLGPDTARAEALRRAEERFGCICDVLAADPVSDAGATPAERECHGAG